jgi:hypothetical protein
VVIDSEVQAGNPIDYFFRHTSDTRANYGPSRSVCLLDDHRRILPPYARDQHVIAGRHESKDVRIVVRTRERQARQSLRELQETVDEWGGLADHVAVNPDSNQIGQSMELGDRLGGPKNRVDTLERIDLTEESKHVRSRVPLHHRLAMGKSILDDRQSIPFEAPRDIAVYEKMAGGNKTVEGSIGVEKRPTAQRELLTGVFRETVDACCRRRLAAQIVRRPGDHLTVMMANAEKFVQCQDRDDLRILGDRPNGANSKMQEMMKIDGPYMPRQCLTKGGHEFRFGTLVKMIELGLIVKYGTFSSRAEGQFGSVLFAARRNERHIAVESGKARK